MNCCENGIKWIDNGYLHLHAYGDDYKQEINFCPFCGKELVEYGITIETFVKGMMEVAEKQEKLKSKIP